MVGAITSINIYNPTGSLYYSDAALTCTDFPITDSCERSAKLMGEDYVRLVFKLENLVTFDAFSYIKYGGQTFFLKEQYIPSPNGTLQETGGGVSSAYYSYDVKFVSVANMLNKHVCYRHVIVNGDNGGEWYEPEININGVLETLYVIVIGAIKRASNQHVGTYYGQLLNSIYSNGIAADGINPNLDNVKLTSGTTLRTFNFSGESIANVCTTIANTYTEEDKKDTEWYITEEYDPIIDSSSLTLHMSKCISDESEQVFTDYVKADVGAYAFAHPYVTGGLKKVEYAQALSDIPQRIVPFGSDRNMSGRSVKGIDAITSMQSTFGKRLRLHKYENDGVTLKYYNIIDENGNPKSISVDENGALENTYVNTGIEQVKFFDEVYPQGHFRVSNVSVRNKRQDGETIPEYTIEAVPIDTQGNLINKIDLTNNGFYPINIEEGTTLSVRFEKGLLSGREFEISNKTRKDEGATTYSLKFTIVADGSIEDGTLIPSGNFRPYGDNDSPTGRGDEFALFNMKMPEVYIDQAERELAQKAYDELVKIQTTRPEVKCSTDPTNFNGNVAFGNVINVYSELFNSYGNEFKSRIISYSHKLTKTSEVQFSLASAVMQGTLSSMNDAIADVTHTTGGLEQRTINLSRRAWRDASEVAEMVDSMQTEMMLVGEAKYQFSFTSSLECEHNAEGFVGLKIGYGSIQHTQEPYINYNNKGWWEVGSQILTTDESSATLDKDTPYYVYAKVQDITPSVAEMVLSTTQYDKYVDPDSPKADDAYLLLGVLSSEFEGKRVVSRTNGFSSIQGGTITTEQIQDAGRNLIIDFQSNPPRIIARGKAEIMGNIKFTLTQEQIDSIVSSMPEAEAIGEIGGENLFRAEDWADWEFRPSSFAHKLRSDDLQAGKYVMTGKVYSTYSGCKVLAQYSDGTTKEMFSDSSKSHLSTSATEDNLVTTGVGITLDLSFEMEKSGYVTIIPTSPSTSNYYRIALVEVMLQKGDRATAYQPWVNYLTKALQGQTSVAGGLLATSVILLRDGDDVTAGMSGVKDDNILLFGGGSYDEAVNAALSEDYDNGFGAPITTLFKKDGTGKAGVFKIEKDHVSVDTKDGKVVMDDDDGLGCYRPTDQERPVVVVTPKELLSLDDMKQFGEKVTSSDSTNYLEEDTITVDVYGRPDGTYSGSSMYLNAGLIAAGGILEVNGDAHAFYVNQEDEKEITLSDEYVKCEISNSEGLVRTLYLTRQTQTVSIEKADYYSMVFTPYVKVEGAIELPWEQDRRYQYNIGFDSHDTFCSYSKEYHVAEKQTTIAYKGLFSYQGEFAYLYYKDGVGFDCYVGNNRLRVTKDGIIIEGDVELVNKNISLSITENGFKATGIPQYNASLEEGTLYYRTTEGGKALFIK